MKLELENLKSNKFMVLKSFSIPEMEGSERQMAASQTRK